jgi:hypothetical protein
MKIIVNADDFGLSSSVNKAIVDSFNTGLINSTTILAGMPGFEEAVELAHENHFFNKTGIHLSLSCGHPLTEDIVNKDLFYIGDDSGVKKFKRKLFLLSKEDQRITYNELATQIEYVRQAGIPITHVDTHHHIGDMWSVTQILLDLLKAYKIPSMRILNNLSQSSVFYKTGYRSIVNQYIKLHKANFSDYFGNLPESVSKLRSCGPKCKNRKIEIMVHPDYNNDGIIVDRLGYDEIVLNYPEDIKVMLYQ